MTTNTVHGLNVELGDANRRNGPMTWPAAQFRTIGPLVFIRELRANGAGKWELIALALDPVKFVRATAGKLDVTR